jgi:hypothetical protein
MEKATPLSLLKLQLKPFDTKNIVVYIGTGHWPKLYPLLCAVATGQNTSPATKMIEVLFCVFIVRTQIYLQHWILSAQYICIFVVLWWCGSLYTDFTVLIAEVMEHCKSISLTLSADTLRSPAFVRVFQCESCSCSSLYAVSISNESSLFPTVITVIIIILMMNSLPESSLHYKN